MVSPLEARIITQRYFGISNHAWYRLTDEEQAALIREALEAWKKKRAAAREEYARQELN